MYCMGSQQCRLRLLKVVEICFGTNFLTNIPVGHDEELTHFDISSLETAILNKQTKYSMQD